MVDTIHSNKYIQYDTFNGFKMVDTIHSNKYIQYDTFNGFKIYKAVDTVLTSDSKQLLRINDYGQTLNAINYAAIKYLTENYECIRSTFVDFRGRWATQLTDDCPVSTLEMDWVSYKLKNYFGEESIEFIKAIEHFMNKFNKEKVPYEIAKSDIILSKVTINFKVKVIAGKTYYYIDNMFMTDNNVKYKYNKNKKCNVVNSKDTVCKVDNLSKQMDTMYNDIYTILTQIPGVLEMDNSVTKPLVNRVLYSNMRLEQYLTDANIATGYKLF
jgi:galactitol-specific phosphotransferase system IIB component